MPTYEFKCPVCKDTFEVSDLDHDVYCEMGHEETKCIRVYSIGGIVFRGPGFYKTDGGK